MAAGKDEWRALIVPKNAIGCYCCGESSETVLTESFAFDKFVSDVKQLVS